MWLTVISIHLEWLADLQGVPKKMQNDWNNVFLKFECPTI
jgi:hypothetical protein